MTYPLQWRQQVLEMLASEGPTISEVAARFGVGVASVVRRRDFPPEYGAPTTVHNRHNRWPPKGIGRYPFAALTAALAGAPEETAIDGTRIKARRSEAGGKGGLPPADKAYDADHRRTWLKQSGDGYGP